jgi:alkyl hydroperoxide reductase subunit F
MLDEQIKTQLKGYFERIRRPIEIVASFDDSAGSRETRALLEEIAALSDKIALITDGDDARKPSFAIRPSGEEAVLTFAGLPMGHEFNSLVLALLQAGGHPPKITPEAVEQINGLEGEYRFETFFSQSCQNCPEVVQALNAISVLNPRVRHTAIDGAAFPAEATAREVMAVPTIFLNGQPFGQGRMSIEEILAKIDSGASARDAERLNAKAPYDVLIVGGGPAGAAAAIYSARKGIRTGVVAERFGGQTLDTIGIENLISVPHTEGPKLAKELETLVRAHEVDVMPAQRAAELRPALPGGLAEIRLDNGAVLKARTIVLSTGARWRQMNVPGEAEYRNRGVAYCPHCDGPLFKGKRVAVIGGGNSGVEAAIDLAGITAHVTLFEFDPKLRADEVLQSKLRSLTNVTVVTSAQTTEVIGDGSKVVGIAYKERASGAPRRVDLDGIFVQIGLVPNTEWLKGAVKLSPRGEIEVDARGQTSAAGVFAAGDATTAPFKQIVIAMGSGATAALSAFDCLMRAPAPLVEAA